MTQGDDVLTDRRQVASNAGSMSLNQTSNAEIATENSPSLGQLRAAIPAHCFESSLSRSLAYLARDLLYAAILVGLALQIDKIPSTFGQTLAWAAYMFIQGCVGTGLWILGHECGHGAFSPYRKVNDCLGWLIHSALLVPYFSWKITHARHHRYTGHITKDAVFVPKTEEDLKEQGSSRLEKLLDMAEETPIVTMFRLIRHQLLGWQIYLFWNATAGKDSLPASDSKATKPEGMSHFAISSKLFLPSQKMLVLLSDMGILFTLGALAMVAQHIGYRKVLLLYLGPYIWTHHWLVAITYLHHTHPDVPHYTNDEWTFLQGALGTVDRSVGFVGQHFFHEIIDFHVVHHLFPKIPFYHAEAATKAIQPLLGLQYNDAKQDSFYQSLYSTFKSCKFVAERKHASGTTSAGRLYWVIS